MTKTLEKSAIPENLEQFGLTEQEYAEISKRLSRDPNELELYLFSAMWSEHCGYKHSKKYLSILPKTGAAFATENSGGVKIGRHIVFFKTESHNHPSAVEPYQGAATGIGGILRDILAMNARPIALLNSLKFGPLEPENGFITDSKEIKRNRYLLNGVVEGISDYGNSVGVPTIAGEVSFNSCYNSSPIVNVMAVGLADKKEVKTAAAKANSLIVLIGSKTGRDGLYGAAFASKELENSSEDRLSVQIGDPYVKKNVIEATLKILKSKNVYSCQDLGAAGLLSSTSEMAQKGKVALELYLERVPLREKGMKPHEIMLSESQERMVFCCNENGAKEIEQICKDYEIDCAIIGKALPGKEYSLFYNDKKLCSLDIDTLVNPILYDLKPRKTEIPRTPLPKNKLPVRDLIIKLVGNPDFASKRYIYSQYDYTVGARTCKNPHALGVAPICIPEENAVIGFSMDSNESQSFLDPYAGGFNAIYEGFRNAISSGFEPLGITNCLNFGNPENEEVAYQFTETLKGMRDALLSLKIPVVSGNVSFYNENSSSDGISSKLKIHPTPVIGTLSILKTKKPIYAKVSAGDTLFCIGKQINSSSNTGGSLYHKAFWGIETGEVDLAELALEIKLKKAIFKLHNKNALKGAVDVNKGGIIGAILVMLFNSDNNTGLKAELTEDINELFGEITGRYLISGHEEKIEAFLKREKIEYKKLGKATTDSILDLDFQKFEIRKLREIYFSSLEQKA